MKQPVEPVWYRETDLSRFDAVLIPGGFSYGDYLRAGAIARFAPIMEAVARFAERGGPVLGMCNGFQILTEAGLLPGALLPNGSLQFRSLWVHTRVERSDTPWTAAIDDGTVLTLPIAHGEGRYFADPETVEQLEQDGRDHLSLYRSVRKPNDRIESERFNERDRRNLQRAAERRWSDAAPGARVRARSSAATTASGFCHRCSKRD